MEWRPALRDDLTWAPQADLTGDVGDRAPALYDPVLNRHVNLGPLSAALVRRLAGGLLTVGQVLDEVAAETGRQRGQVEHGLRTLMLMNLVAGCGPEVLRQATAVRDGTAPCPPRFLPETRFGCQGSGDCCRSYVFGPLREEDLSRLDLMGPAIQAAYPDLGPPPYVQEQPMAGGATGTFLRTVGQRCLFQLGDGRCGLHAALGEAAKPAMCRLYPYQQQPTIWGRRIYDRGECSRFAESVADGPHLRDEVERVLGLLPASVEIYHPLLWLDAETPCDYGHFHLLQEALCALCLLPLPPAALLQALAGRLRRFIEALRRIPLLPGEPDHTVAAAVAEGPPPSAGAPAAAAFQALLRVAGALRYALAPRRLILQLARSQHRANQQAQDLDDTLMAIEALGMACADPGRGLGERYRDLPAVAVEGAIAAALRTSLRHQIFGDRLLLLERPVAGLLRVALSVLVAVTRARLLAPAGGAVGLAEFDRGHALAMRVLAQDFATTVFVEHEELAWEAIAACAALLQKP